MILKQYGTTASTQSIVTDLWLHKNRLYQNKYEKAL
jgi:hypothetical protein